MKKIFSFISVHGLILAWLIAVLGFTLSIGYGEIWGNVPCFLCWYQRMALFPIVIILAIACFKGDFNVVPYMLVFSFLGAFIAIFHSLLPYVSFFRSLSLCRMGVSCVYEGLAVFFPFLSFFGFLAIIVLLLMVKKQ